MLWMEVWQMTSKIRALRRRPILSFTGFLIIVLIYLSGCSSRYNASTLDGQSIFASNCTACHTIGGGNLAGPDLKGVTEQQSQQWLVSFISNPDQVITARDATANALLRKYNYIVMPNMGLTTNQVLAVIGYIQKESSLTERPTPVTTPGISLLQGNPANGKAIFLGTVHLQNGAPFCIGCHVINDTGILGGGTLGPNLTNAYSTYGDAGLEGILSNLPFLTMRPIYANNTLTEQEKADLRAFMKSVDGSPQVNKEPLIIGISLVGTLIIMVGFAIVWRNRLRTVRQELVKRAKGSR